MADPQTRNAAFLFSQSACALIEAMGMMAENRRRQFENIPPYYIEEDFKGLIEKYGIHHNAALTMLDGE